jgi:hypothetical protein
LRIPEYLKPQHRVTLLLHLPVILLNQVVQVLVGTDERLSGQIEEVITAPRSSFQNPYAERVIGSIRRRGGFQHILGEGVTVTLLPYPTPLKILCDSGVDLVLLALRLFDSAIEPRFIWALERCPGLRTHRAEIAELLRQFAVCILRR